MYKQLASAALFAAGVNAHGHLVSPEPRPLGSAMEAACGTQVYDMMSSDENGNIQTMAQTGASQSDYNATACHLWQCRGYQFGDATSSTIHSYSAGQTLDFTVDIAAPHTGVANVSVINLAENAVIGDPLISFTNYASTATGVAANNTAFSVTLPDSLPDVCSTSGGCALQWWWDARSIDQTYMSCADFVWTGASSSSSSSSSSASSAVASSAAASSTVAASSSSAAVVVASSAAAQAVTTSAASSVVAPTTLATSVAAAATTSEAVAATTSETVAASSAVASSTSSCSKKRAARRAALAARKN